MYWSSCITVHGMIYAITYVKILHVFLTLKAKKQNKTKQYKTKKQKQKQNKTKEKKTSLDCNLLSCTTF